MYKVQGISAVFRRLIRDKRISGAPHLASGDRCLEELGAFTIGRAVHALHILEVYARVSPVLFIILYAWNRPRCDGGNLVEDCSSPKGVVP